MENQVKRKIFLVDDDTSLLVTLSDFLRYEGYEVVTAESGEQALKKLQSITPDLIILDMSMPGMGGVGFLRHISSADGKPSYPVLVLTARANMAEFFANVEVDGFVAKPCAPSDLLMEVGRIIFLRGSNKPEKSGSVETAKKSVLIGDDDIAGSAALSKMFVEEGYVVNSSSKGPEVLEKAIISKPDVVVMKALLFGMNGEAVARMMKEMPNTKDIPVVIYGGDEVPGAQSKYTQQGSGVKKYVSGNDPASVLAAVNNILKS